MARLNSACAAALQSTLNSTFPRRSAATGWLWAGCDPGCAVWLNAHGANKALNNNAAPNRGISILLTGNMILSSAAGLGPGAEPGTIASPFLGTPILSP